MLILLKDSFDCWIVDTDTIVPSLLIWTSSFLLLIDICFPLLLLPLIRHIVVKPLFWQKLILSLIMTNTKEQNSICGNRSGTENRYRPKSRDRWSINIPPRFKEDWCTSTRCTKPRLCYGLWVKCMRSDGAYFGLVAPPLGKFIFYLIFGGEMMFVSPFILQILFPLVTRQRFRMFFLSRLLRLHSRTCRYLEMNISLHMYIHIYKLFKYSSQYFYLIVFFIKNYLKWKSFFLMDILLLNLLLTIYYLNLLLKNLITKISRK